jgi:hypothetical protein
MDTGFVVGGVYQNPDEEKGGISRPSTWDRFEDISGLLVLTVRMNRSDSDEGLGFEKIWRRRSGA